MFTSLRMNIMSTSHFLTNSSSTHIHQGVLTYTKLQAKWLFLEHFQVSLSHFSPVHDQHTNQARKKTPCHSTTHNFTILCH